MDTETNSCLRFPGNCPNAQGAPARQIPARQKLAEAGATLGSIGAALSLETSLRERGISIPPIATPDAVRALALELANGLPFCSGHAGLSFYAMLGYRETEEKLSQLCLRYPGMDVFLLRSLSWKLGTRMKGPAWLTFLGQPVLGELGGVEGLRTRLSSPGTTVEPLPGDRAVISLGPWPEAGDIDAGRNLPEYRELARALGPHLYRPSRSWSPYFPEDVWQRWAHRFD